MTAPPTPAAPGEAAALYRRFRPGRFADLRGQDHVVRALQGAVASGRVVHAYLFSGPRGTGKTTAARILAKALNCENPVDGDACDACSSCRAISSGASLDVTELDAASNNGVDDVREITAGAWHNTPGRWRVYIVDEVHQLSRAASAALLKTLEEPPAHVIFVLATTDPHKVLPTIRSRTQHLEFRLMGGETLGALLRDIRDAAHLDADEATIESAVRLARGSARDALSALDQLVATGPLGGGRPGLEPLLAALAADDATGAIVEVARLSADGWDIEQLAESLAAEVRQAFLLQVAPGVADALGAERDRLESWGAGVGLARTVRVLESLGRAIREMRSAPDRLVVLEVTLARLTRPELDPSLDALAERVDQLERRGASAPPSSTPTAPRRPIGASAPTREVTAPAPPPVREAPVEAVEPSPAPSSVPAPALDLDDVRERFAHRVISRTSRSAQMLLRGARVTALLGSRLIVAVPSDEVRKSAADYAPALQRALDHEFGAPLSVEWVIDATLVAAPLPESRRSARPAEVPDDSDDAGGEGIVVESAGEHLITEMFPGAEEIG
ncbi:MAG TPA: DNA polymerase III subunit gamma/tau [Acidimicrobiales bacterium]|nr:DNA polymerase III subunit gamma/tau [Acidimicrobiales bacterium]